MFGIAKKCVLCTKWVIYIYYICVLCILCICNVWRATSHRIASQNGKMAKYYIYLSSYCFWCALIDTIDAYMHIIISSQCVMYTVMLWDFFFSYIIGTYYLFFFIAKGDTYRRSWSSSAAEKIIFLCVMHALYISDAIPFYLPFFFFKLFTSAYLYKYHSVW